MATQKNIAIVAVHGVGNHNPGESATMISRLLLRIPRALGGRFTSFSESPIGIPTSLVPEAVTAEQVELRRTRVKQERTRKGLYDERPERSARNPDADRQEDDFAPPADVRFMRDQLRDYRPDPESATYETIRLEGRHLEADRREQESNTADARIHVYEMYWSDISRVGASILSVFGAFYQVVIHLPYVGLITLEESRKNASDQRGWDSLLAAYRWAMRAMTLVAPTINIIMLAVGLAALTHLIPPSARKWVALSVPTLGVFAATSWWFYHHRTKLWWVNILSPIVAGVATFFFLKWFPLRLHGDLTLVFEWWLVAWLPLRVVFKAFNKNRPFAFPLAVGLWLLVGLLFLLIAAARAQDTTATIIGTLEYLNIGLLITWFVFGLSTALVAFFGWRISGRAGNREAVTKRAAFTARFALALPGVAFGVVTLTIWGALVAAESGKVFPGDAQYAPLIPRPYVLEKHQAKELAAVVEKARHDSIDLSQRGMLDSARRIKAQAILSLGGARYYLRTFGGSADGFSGLVGAGFVALAFLALFWVLIPVLITEVSSPPLDQSSRDAPGFNERSKRLGTWLSTAFRTGRISGEILVFVIMLSTAGVLIAAPMLSPQWFRDFLDWLPAVSFSFINVGSWVIGAGVVGLYAVVTRISYVGSRLRPVFGIMADVDNYLRELPRDRTPRARMAERYASLLRYLCRWRADETTGKGYDAIVIVSHSQGTVITADLLRYLGHYKAGQGQFEPHLKPIGGVKPALPIYLMTMGSPLRQLYGQRFPDVYSWVGGSSDSTGIQTDPERSKLLGVVSWTNLYRSGDYVGRSLWQTPDDDQSLYMPHASVYPSGDREACLGPGAHTHYWDESAESVALCLNEVIEHIIANG